MRFAPITVLVCLLAGIAGLLFWSSAETPTDSPEVTNPEQLNLEPAPTSDEQVLGREGIAEEASDSEARGAAVQASPKEAAAEPLQSVTVLVVGMDGEPRPGVPVVLLREEIWGEEPLETGKTDEQGSIILHDQRMFGTNQKVRKMTVGFPFPCKGASEPVGFQGDAWPTETITLQLPDTGGIEVHLLDLDGQPWLHPVKVHLAPISMFTGKGKAIRKKSVANTGLDVVDGIARFPHVGLNQRLEIGVPWDNWAEWSLVRTAGPKSNGELIQVDLRIKKASPRWQARLLYPDGAPFLAQPVQVMHKDWRQYGGGTGSSTGFVGNFQTDDTGLLEFPFLKDLDGEHAKLEISAGPRGGEGFGYVEVPINKQMLGLDQDFGDLELATAQPLASGTVLNASGEGIDAHVYVYEAIYDPFGKSTDPTFDWAPGSHSTVDASGSFQSIGITDSPLLRLVVEAEGYLEQERKVDRGTTGIQIVLQGDLGISGSLQLPEGILAKNLEIRFFLGGPPFGLNRHSSDQLSVTPHEDGGFRLSGFETFGSGSLVVLHEDTGALLAQVDQVTPAPHTDAPDPRLNPWTLDALFLYEIEVIGPGGGRIKFLDWEILQPEIYIAPTNSFFIGNRRQFLLTSDAATIGVLADGYRYQELQLHPGETVIEMERAPLVQFQAPDLPRLPEGYRYTVELDALDGPDLLDVSGNLPAGIGGGIFPVPMAAAGRYRVQLGIWNREHGISVDVTDASGPWTFEFQVLEGVTGQQIEVPIPLEAIEAALQRAITAE